MRSADGITGDPELDIIHLGRDHMVDHPAGAHYVLWNGPAFLDVGVPAGGFVRFAVANLTTQWTLLMDPQGRQLPVAVRNDGPGLAIRWLPYDGPGARPAARVGRRLSDAENEVYAHERLNEMGRQAQGPGNFATTMTNMTICQIRAMSRR
jgi:hypothetical protein